MIIGLAVALVIISFVVTSGDDSPLTFSSDAPGQWLAQSSGITTDLVDVVFVDSDNGWAIGDHGTIVHTSDGGNTWETQDSGSIVDLAQLSFPTVTDGWVVGKFGTILRTSDGGKTWEQQAGSDVTRGLNLAAVSFVDERTGWAITNVGSILLKTENGGETWERRQFSSTSERSDLFFLDTETGFAALTQGGVLRTSDGGESWQHQKSVNAGTTNIFFLDENHGWITGWRDKGQGLQFAKFLSDGIVARTIDGGQTWTKKESGTGKFLWDVRFVTLNEGWAVGSFGLILYSNDGGETWEPQPSGTQATLRGADFTDQNTGWAVGVDGTILKFTR